MIRRYDAPARVLWIDCVGGIFKVGRVPSCPGFCVMMHVQDSLLQARRSVIFSSVTSLAFSSWRPCGTISMKSTPTTCCNTHTVAAFRCDLAPRLPWFGRPRTHARAHPRGSTILHPPLFSLYDGGLRARMTTTGTGNIHSLLPARAPLAGLSILLLFGVLASRNFMELMSALRSSAGGGAGARPPHACRGARRRRRARRACPSPSAHDPTTAYGLRPPLRFGVIWTRDRRSSSTRSRVGVRRRQHGRAAAVADLTERYPSHILYLYSLRSKYFHNLASFSPYILTENNGQSCCLI